MTAYEMRISDWRSSVWSSDLDNARVHAVLLYEAGVRDMPQAVRSLTKSAKPVIGPQRIASGRDEIDQPVERLPFQRHIGRGPARLVEHNVRIERRGTGAGPHLNRKSVRVGTSGPARVNLAGRRYN